jgi:hypothetical protein
MSVVHSLQQSMPHSAGMQHSLQPTVDVMHQGVNVGMTRNFGIDPMTGSPMSAAHSVTNSGFDGMAFAPQRVGGPRPPSSGAAQS